MKKYYMSFVDFSEIINVTADEEQLTKACDRMAELELLTEKGNPSTAQIGIVAQAEAGPFYDKLKKRISRRPGGIAGTTRRCSCIWRSCTAFWNGRCRKKSSCFPPCRTP